MRRNSALLAGTVCLVIASGAYGKPIVLKCDVAAGASQGGIVNALYFLQFEPGLAEGQVIDGLIKHETGGMIAMKVIGDAANRTDFSWRFRAKTSSGAIFPVIFKATYFKADKSFVVSGTISGGNYVGSAEGRGSCKAQ